MGPSSLNEKESGESGGEYNGDKGGVFTGDLGELSRQGVDTRPRDRRSLSKSWDTKGDGCRGGDPSGDPGTTDSRKTGTDGEYALG